jgi:NADH-quinone oxidoreductase subunit H
MAGFVPQFVTNGIDWAFGVFASLPEWVQYLTTTTWKILIVLIGVILIVAFSTYFERKVIGSMQARIGPNRVGPLGLRRYSRSYRL